MAADGDSFTSDPYAMVHVANPRTALGEVEDGKSRAGLMKETKVISRTCDPVWDEQLLFKGVQQTELLGGVLKIFVYDDGESTALRHQNGCTCVG